MSGDALASFLLSHVIHGFAWSGIRFPDGTWRLTSLVGAVEEVTGYPGAFFLEAPDRWVETTHPDDRAALLEVVAGLSANCQPVNHEHRLMRPGGEIRWCQVTLWCVAVAEVNGVVSDVTDRRRMEERVRQGEKLEAVGQLAGGIAHDFNNLLTVILANVDLIRLNRGERLEESLELIFRAAERAAELTSRLLDFARRRQLQLSEVEPGELLAVVVEKARRTFECGSEGDGSSPAIEVVAVSGEPVGRLRADRELLQQALFQLCANARDAMPEGGTLTLEVRNVDWDGRPFVRFRASDTGHGIAAEVRLRIFEPFFTTRPVGQGSGLGLAMVHGIVQQHHGWVECQSEVGKGACFDLFLPRL